jgi:hypothetical protein
MSRIFLLLSLVTLLTGNKLSGAGLPPSDSFTVCLFLLEDCKITQAYSRKMSTIYLQYAHDSIGFIGYFPNSLTTEEGLATFVKKYEIPFPCTRQDAYALAKKWKVSVTPEVVVWNETQQKIVYQGRIDNLYERIGQRRKIVTSFELEAALYSIRHHEPISIPRTNAIGCFLN